MGRQLGLYMLPEDEDNFLLHLRASGDVLVIRERSGSSEPVVVERLSRQGSPEARMGVVLWNRAITPTLRLRRVGPEFFFVDKSNSEVIEFSRSEIVDGKLTREGSGSRLTSLD